MKKNIKKPLGSVALDMLVQSIPVLLGERLDKLLQLANERLAFDKQRFDVETKQKVIDQRIEQQRVDNETKRLTLEISHLEIDKTRAEADLLREKRYTKEGAT